MRTAKHAFTLVEILAVTAIIGILAALLLAGINSAKNSARRTTCLNNLRQINLGVRLYAEEHNETFPVITNSMPPVIWTDYEPFIRSYVGLKSEPSRQDELFSCPADTFYYIDTQRFSKSHHLQSVYKYSSYTFNAGNMAVDPPAVLHFPGIAGWKSSSIKEPVRTILVAEFPALLPYSWHQMKGPYYSDARDMVSFVDGHVNYSKIFWDTNSAAGHLEAWHYDPPTSYDYRWSGN